MPGAGEGFGGEDQDFVAAVAQNEMIHGQLEKLGQAGFEQRGAAFRVAVQILHATAQSSQGLGAGAKRVLVAGQLDGMLQAQLALDFLQGLAGFVDGDGGERSARPGLGRGGHAQAAG